ncbi:hypothetical protein VTN77DRAFT_419 [Rasamsonia byssochlamydoides]|uniref:uncharacterized protein n=1 Tax=Rasamsonia byssochlamydoides TaxID=89139 RepID=UPI00374339C9
MSPPDERASPENTAGFNRAISYSSSSQAGLDVQVVVGHSQQAVGLGIFQGGMELPFHQLRDNRSMQLPLHCWSDHPISTPSFCGPASSAPGYRPVTAYPSYNESSAVQPSLVGFSGITSHDVVYSPDVRDKENNIPIYRQPSGAWSLTPPPQTNTPSRVQIGERQRANSAWEVPVAHNMPFFSDALNQNRRSSVESSTSPESSPAGTRNRRRSGRRGRSLSPYELRFPCAVCGYAFSRNSNRREHMKKHDPNHKRKHSCGDCGKQFDRKTDLERHFSSVHEGAKPFSCDRCGACFARRDTLYRHHRGERREDGCANRPRNVPK